jgi:HlyD family secretion protein
VLDASDYQAAEAQAQAAQAAVRRAKEELAGAEASFQYAKEEHRRLQRLHEQGTASQQQLDQAEVEFKQARARHRAATEAVAQAKGELAAAQSRLAQETPSPDALPSRVSIRAPVDGRLLRVHQESAGVVQAGTSLFTVGNPDSLEVAIDVLSSDAVRMSAGTPVEIVRWGGDRTLRGTVRVVEPLGRTEVSALGVEEQRVEVVSDVELPAAVQGRLGTGYRVVARFVLWDGADVLQVPQSALFRHDGGWAVFTVRGGRAERQPVTVGHRSGLRAQITDGLTEGAQVITHPGEQLSDGTRVAGR